MEYVVMLSFDAGITIEFMELHMIFNNSQASL